MMNKPVENAKYPNTKRLIEKVIEKDGLTQQQIAELCSVQQSVVSGWKNGNKIASWKHVFPLIEKYGDVIGESECTAFCRIRNSRYVFDDEAIKYLQSLIDYRNFIQASEAKVDSDMSKINEYYLETISKIQSDLRKSPVTIFNTLDESLAFLKSYGHDGSYLDSLLFGKCFHDLLGISHKYDGEFVKVYGNIVFDYNFKKKEDFNEDESITWMKWTVLSNDNGKLSLVIRKRKNFINRKYLDPSHEDATWLAEIHEDIDANTVLRMAKTFKFDPISEQFIDREVVLLSLVQAFSRYGYDLEGVGTIR